MKPMTTHSIRLKPIADKLGGHGGMDAIMNLRVIECLTNGQPLDQNVYEGVSGHQ